MSGFLFAKHQTQVKMGGFPSQIDKRIREVRFTSSSTLMVRYESGFDRSFRVSDTKVTALQGFVEIEFFVDPNVHDVETFTLRISSEEALNAYTAESGVIGAFVDGLHRAGRMGAPIPVPKEEDSYSENWRYAAGKNWKVRRIRDVPTLGSWITFEGGKFGEFEFETKELAKESAMKASEAYEVPVIVLFVSGCAKKPEVPKIEWFDSPARR